jgi:uncharacterized membrane-anchored protein YitT (DUF2179 family)
LRYALLLQVFGTTLVSIGLGIAYLPAGFAAGGVAAIAFGIAIEKGLNASQSSQASARNISER